MSTAIICVGYTCPACGKRVTVLRSSDPALEPTDIIETECPCGLIRPINIDEVQSLDVWYEPAA
jgi:hypothetical protein